MWKIFRLVPRLGSPSLLPVLARHLCSPSFLFILVPHLGSLSWLPILVLCLGYLPWLPALVTLLGPPSWSPVFIPWLPCRLGLGLEVFGACPEATLLFEKMFGTMPNCRRYVFEASWAFEGFLAPLDPHGLLKLFMSGARLLWVELGFLPRFGNQSKVSQKSGKLFSSIFSLFLLFLLQL